MPVLTATGNFLVGAGAEVAGEALEDEDLDPRSIVIAGITNIPQYGLRLRPGTPMGSIHSNNFLKFIGQQIGGAIANFGANWLINSANNIADNSNKASVVSSSTSSGGGGGGTSTLGSNSIQQVIRSAGGSTLKTAEQRAASEAAAASIISRQRAAAQKSSSSKR